MRRVDEVISGVGHGQDQAVPLKAQGSPARGAVVSRNVDALDSPVRHVQCVQQPALSVSPAKSAASPLMTQEVQPTDQIRSQEKPPLQIGDHGARAPITHAVGLPAPRWVSSGRSWPTLHPAVAALEAEVDNDAPQETSLAGWRLAHEESSLSAAAPVREVQPLKPLVITETVFHYSR